MKSRHLQESGCNRKLSCEAKKLRLRQAPHSLSSTDPRFKCLYMGMYFGGNGGLGYETTKRTVKKGKEVGKSGGRGGG